MRSSTASALLVSAILATLLALGIAPHANADNVNKNVSSITMDAGTTNTELKVKIVANTAQNPAGDDQAGCNASDGTPAKVHLNISPAEGLTASPNPIIFDKCGNPPKTVTLTASIGGTYEITATVEDAGSSPPGDPGYGVYHTEPFGIVTVVVVDETTPETTIDSGPANPTANQTATFEFSANEAGSTFECSLDGSEFLACTSPATYHDLVVGSHTFAVRATDPTGNVDGSPATHSWTIKEVKVEVSQIIPDSEYWGLPVSATGIAETVDLTNLTLEIDWGDDTTSPAEITDGTWGPIEHSYDDPGNYLVTARLIDGTTPYLSSEPFPVSINKKPSNLSLTIPNAVTGDTGLNARGFLTEDLPGGLGIPGGIITFDGSGSNPTFNSVTTEGVTVTGGLELLSCAVGPCSVELTGIDGTPNNNVVLRVSPGSEVIFPADTAQAMVTIQGNADFKYTVYQNPDSPLPCPDNPGFVCEKLFVPGLIRQVGGVSDFTIEDDIRVFSGLSKIVITEIEGSETEGFLDISAILTSNPGGKPLEQREINFEDETLGEVTDPVTFDAGSYSTIGIVQVAAEEGLALQAHFAENSHYLGSHSTTEVYKVDFNSNSQEGVGGEGVVGDGFAASRDLCAVDGDKDGICSIWEDGSIERSGGGVYNLFEPPAGDGTPDVYYEVDCMTGFCPLVSDLDAVKQRFELKGIDFHYQLDDTFAAKNPFHVWADSGNDGISNNAFVEAKNSLYGTAADRSGGTLGSGTNNVLKAKLQVVRYLVVVQNINSGTSTACGTSGVAEYRGNDAVAAVKACGFGINPREELRGTIMHEIGHNLGLRHGGGDDVNGKPNQIGVMSYKGQVPTSVLGKPSAAQLGDGDATTETVTQVPWILDYNREVFPSIVESDVDDGFVLNIDPTKWIASDGKDRIGSFKIYWGTPQLATKVQTGYTGAGGINWDKDANSGELNQKMDLNYMALTIGSKVITTLQPANSYYPNLLIDKAETFTSYDEWQIVKNNLDDFTSYGSFDGVHTDADYFAEAGDLIEALNGLGFLFPGVDSPLNNVDLGSTGITKIKLGNTVPIKFDLFDAQGIEITGDNALSTYRIENITIRVAQVSGGNPPLDEDYGPPLTSTQEGHRDFFSWDGNKWAFSMGTKNLPVNAVYAARISLVFETDEEVVVESGSDGITFLFTTVKKV